MNRPANYALPLEDELDRAKMKVITAAYQASPMRMIERHPIASVTATAAATMAATIIGSSGMFSRTGAGVLRQGFGLASTLAGSSWAQSAIASLLPKFMPAPASPVSPSSASPVSDNTNAVG